MSAEVPEAASAEEQKVSVRGERAGGAQEAQSRPYRGPGLAGGLVPSRAVGRPRREPRGAWCRVGCASAPLLFKAELSRIGCSQ